MNGRQSLHCLLDNLNDVHKNDMKEINGGHLNENKLWREKEHVKMKVWEKANQPSIRLCRTVKTLPVSLPRIKKSVENMTDVMTDFAIGPNASKTTGSCKKGKRKVVKNKTENAKEIHHESMLPDLMLPVSSQNKEHSFKKDFVPTHHILPSKSEQYKQMKKLRNNLLDDITPFGAGKKTTSQHIENRLKKRLRLLREKGDCPNFDVWKIYSDAWDELCDTSETYGDVLSSIKKDYDTYINELFDKQLEMNTPVTEYTHLYVAKNRTLLKEHEERIRQLESEVMHELTENNRLRQELKEATCKKEHFLDYLDSDAFLDVPDKATEEENEFSVQGNEHDLEKEVETLHNQIEVELRNLEEIKKRRKENYVPIAVCERLEHCLKETEVDIQKLCKQNEFLEHNIEELEEELDEVLVKTGLKTKDARILWRRASASRVLYT